MRETRWNETKVFAQITSVSNILLGFFYLGGTKVQKGGSLFPNPFRDSLIHPAMRLDSRKALAERIVPRPFHSSHLISSLCTNTFWDAAALWQQMAAPCRNGAAEGMLTCCITDCVPRRPSLLSGVSASWRLGWYCEVAFNKVRSPGSGGRVRTQNSTFASWEVSPASIQLFPDVAHRRSNEINAA
jgi:hypothetical protein